MADEIHTMSHREYIGDIITSAANTSGASAFQLQAFYINPMSSLCFPWLSTIAGNFTNFRFKKLKFEFVSSSATALNSTNTALGLVYGRQQADSTIQPDVNATMMLNSWGTHKSNPSLSWQFVIDCSKDRIGTCTQVTQPLGLPANTDSRLFYPNGFFEIASQGMQANNVNIGQLFVSYTVDLLRPVYLQGELGFTMRSAHFSDSAFTNSLPLGSTNLNAIFDNIGMTVTGTQISFPVAITTGTYLVLVSWWGTNASITFPTITGTNCSLLPNVFFNQTTSEATAPVTGTTTGRAQLAQLVQVNAPGTSIASLAFGTGGSLPVTTGQWVDIVITQVNGNIV